MNPAAGGLASPFQVSATRSERTWGEQREPRTGRTGGELRGSPEFNVREGAAWRKSWRANIGSGLWLSYGLLC